MTSDQDVLLRVPTLLDAQYLFDLFNDAEVMSYIGNGEIRNLDYYQDFVKRQSRCFQKYGFCLFTVTFRGKVAGFVGFQHWDKSWGPQGVVEMGWRLGKQFWGHAIAYTAAKILLSKNPHKELVAMIHPNNQRSQDLAIRLGFTEAEAYTDPQGQEVTCFRRLHH